MTRTPPSADPPKGDADIVPHDEASAAFVRGLVERGEAVQLAPNAPLPPGVTHEIVGKTETGLPILRRRRFRRTKLRRYRRNIVLIPLTAWRMRFSFSIRAKRTCPSP